ncbi:transcription factor Ouib [Drosophila teissieri]|uniref:transcription factor Ouib n=1 Tax=Drosophila teissieri TaxID=7243 RepID=UPI001CBA32DE|nr:transcription factor Ouib [Drosophila teissieri]
MHNLYRFLPNEITTQLSVYQSSLEIEMLNKVCRVCGRQKICEKSLNLFDLANRKYLKHLHMITGLRLLELEDVPGFMCVCCQSELRSALAFRKLCIKTQRKWLAIEEEDSASDEEDTKAKSQLESEKCVLVEETFQVLIEEESTDNSLIRYTEAEQSDDEIDVKWAPTRKVLKVSTKLDDKIYICELCGTHATSKSVFQRHMRKHTGERPFGCKDCKARFLSSGELRAHHRVHTGEQPFACRFCEKRYVSYMGRLIHERTHTNDRPYVCEECGKKFTTAYVLRNHMVIHTGERNFRCDLCDRSFQRNSHLKTHSRSMMHLQKVKSQKSSAK